MAKHNSNTIIKFVVVLITNSSGTAYREEVRDLAVWCQDNNLSLTVSKTKELIVDYRKMRAKHTPINIDGAVVDQVKRFKYLGVHIPKKLSWSKYTKRARQHIFPFRRQKEVSMVPQFYSCTIESILTGCITTWYDNCSASDRKALHG
jgi:hypothetical protein